jgi:hypothetical protein
MAAGGTGFNLCAFIFLNQSITQAEACATKSHLRGHLILPKTLKTISGIA